jgi:transcriptional regulator with XRE-family HTH domain
MTAVAENRLENIKDELTNLIEPFVREFGRAAKEKEVDQTYLARFEETARRLVDLNEDLHEEDFDPRALAEFRGIILSAVKVVNDADPNRPLDTIDSLLIHAEQLRHIVRDAMDGHVGGVGQNTKAVMESLKATLPSIRQVELAALLGKSQRQVQRWSSQETPPPRRLEVVARIAALLRHAWTPEGVVAWFFRPRPELQNRKPVDLLDDPDREGELIGAARRGRAQHGS